MLRSAVTLPGERRRCCAGYFEGIGSSTRDGIVHDSRRDTLGQLNDGPRRKERGATVQYERLEDRLHKAQCPTLGD